MDADLVRYECGDLIFREGDAGGYFIIIKSGSVEVFKETAKGEVFLSQLGAGEILGLLSFFSENPRHASARARTVVEGQIVRKSSALNDAKIPQWVHIVLKEYSNRLSQANNLYINAQNRQQESNERLINPLFISCQVADGLATIGPLFAKKVDDGREMIFLSQMIELMTQILGYSESEIKFVFHVFKNYGLIKIELEPDNHQEVTSVKGLQNLKWYTQYVRSAKSGKARKQLDSHLPFKFRRILFGLREYAQKEGLALNKVVSVKLNDLIDKFEGITKTKFDIEAFKQANEISLVELKEVSSEVTISFNAFDLTRTLICMNVIHRLKSDSDLKDV